MIFQPMVRTLEKQFLKSQPSLMKLLPLNMLEIFNVIM